MDDAPFYLVWGLEEVVLATADREKAIDFARRSHERSGYGTVEEWRLESEEGILIWVATDDAWPTGRTNAMRAASSRRAR